MQFMTKLEIIAYLQMVSGLGATDLAFFYRDSGGTLG